MQTPRTIDQARLQANIADRAARITENYVATILVDAVQVTHKADPLRSYIVQDGACHCLSFKHNDLCKHSLGFVALVDAEVARLKALRTVMDSANIRRSIANGEEMAEAARCQMSLASYRECCFREEMAA